MFILSENEIENVNGGVIGGMLVFSAVVLLTAYLN